MTQIFSTAEEVYKKQQQANASNAVLLEAINCLIHLGIEPQLMSQIISILGNFLAGIDVNLRYLALETMTHIAAIGDPTRSLGQYQGKVMNSLKDKDVSVRRQALDLLYSMCEQRNAREIVAELLNYLRDADSEIREEMVLKIAILAEKYVTDYTWYVDVILQLITNAGDHASDAIWHRVVYIVTNHEDLREYAAYTIMQALKQPQCHEMTVRIGGYLLGEFGHFIVESPGCSPFEQFMALQSKFRLFSRPTKAILLSTYFKFVNLFPEIKNEIMRVLENFQYVLDMELQQRACEYYAILQLPDDELLQTVCGEMPHFPERESMLLSQLKNKAHDTEDIIIWSIGGKDAQHDLVQRRGTLTGASATSNPTAREPVEKITEVDDLLGFSTNDLSISQIAPSAHQIEAWLHHLSIQPNGILYEDNILQIGVKSEYQNNLGRIALFYGNKLPGLPLEDFDANVIPVEELNFSVIQPISRVLQPMAQNHQMFNVECASIPIGQPLLFINFTVSGKPMSLELQLPIYVTNFISSVQLSGPDFFCRWKQIGGPPKEAQSVFKPVQGIDITKAKSELRGLHLEILEGIDTNADNIVAAGIFSATGVGKVGCLLRLESNQQHQVFGFNKGVPDNCTNDK
jgi:AP-2 complex subunit alpha